MAIAEAKKVQRQKLEEKIIPPEVLPPVPEATKAIPFPKVPVAGLSLEEILGVGLGFTSPTDIGGNIAYIVAHSWFPGTKMKVHEIINGTHCIASDTARGVIELIEGGFFENSQLYRDTVSAIEGAIKPLGNAITFDLVNLGLDIPMIVVSKGKYRKAFAIKTGVDAALLGKNYLLYKITVNNAKNIVFSVAGEYNSYQEAYNAIKTMVYQKLIPEMARWGKINSLQFPIDIMVSLIAGGLLLYWAYTSTKSEKPKVGEYTTDVV